MNVCAKLIGDLSNSLTTPDVNLIVAQSKSQGITSVTGFILREL